jgi:hypothetical protein
MTNQHVRVALLQLLRQRPFEAFVVTYVGGERAIIEHSENVAIDPTEDGSSKFYVISGGVTMYSTLDKVSSLSVLTSKTTFTNESATASA